jgi:hypothetical protein
MSGSVWEEVYRQPFDIMERYRLDDGYLYRNRLVTGSAAQIQSDYVWGVAITYVADAAVAPLARRRDE